MRLALGLGLAALLALAPAASAQGPALAPGEVLLELSSFGRARTAPDRLEVEGSLYASGDTAEAARRDIDALIRRLRGQLRALGLSDADISIGDPVQNPEYQSADGYNTMGMLESNSFDVIEQGSGSRYSYTASLTVRTRNVALAPRIEQVLSGASVLLVDGARYTLSDPVAARRAARADAIARARAQADDYAAGLNMRVARLVRISERSGPSFMEMMMGGISGGDAGMAALQREMVENPDSAEGVNTIAFLGVDFALAPR
jgi:uncharacterized protein